MESEWYWIVVLKAIREMESFNSAKNSTVLLNALHQAVISLIFCLFVSSYHRCIECLESKLGNAYFHFKIWFWRGMSGLKMNTTRYLHKNLSSILEIGHFDGIYYPSVEFKSTIFIEWIKRSQLFYIIRDSELISTFSMRKNQNSFVPQKTHP